MNLIKKSLFIFLFFLKSFNVVAADNITVIRLLNWWDYLAPKTIKKLEENNFKIDLSVYSSTEIATSRLLSTRDKYDIVIVSGIVKDVVSKAGKLDETSLVNINKKRNYISEITKNNICVPYFWGASVFAYDAKEINNEPKSISDLVKLKNQGVSVGLLDDPFEISTRLKLDNEIICLSGKNKNQIWDKNNCPQNGVLTTQINFSSADFRSDVESFLKKKKSAAYSWHGAAWLAAKENPNIQMVVPQNHPVIGADYVCVPKNRAHPNLSKDKLIKFVELLTDSESTHWGVESTQYFSPYKNDMQGLAPATVSLYKTLINVMAKSKPFILTAPGKEEHQLINNWWRGVRYESKK